MMHFLTYLGTGLSFLSASSSLPTSQPRQKHCDALIEYAPWHVSGTVVYNAGPAAPLGSSIRFHVSDTNPRLEFNTMCRISMPVGTGAKPEDTHRWHTCEDKRLRFLYRPGKLQLSRSYKDDWWDQLDLVSPQSENFANNFCSLGPPPYNSGVFYGNADTHFEITSTEHALTWTQTAMEVPITSQT